MSRSAVHWLRIALVAALVAGGLFGVGGAHTTWAQGSTSLSGLFEPDLAELKPNDALRDAVKKAKGECYPPRIRLTIFVPGDGDPLFLPTLGKARQQAFDAFLPSLGLEPGQFKTSWVLGGVVDGVGVSYGKFTPDDDKDKPTLRVTWDPPSGTKVKVEKQITVTIWASERYQDGHKSWPSGVQMLQLTEERDGQEHIAKPAVVEYGRRPPPCTPREHKPVYTVPENPPATVRLTAIAEDAVGGTAIDFAEFPTGDVWKGKMRSETLLYPPGNPYQCWAEYETTLTLVVGGDGSISGKGRATATKPTTCNTPRDPPPLQSATFRVEGRAYEDRLEIRLHWEASSPSIHDHGGFAVVGFTQGSPTLVIPITVPGVAEGQSTVSRWGVTCNNTFRLRCETCGAGPGVG